jgi:hypothetical protein
MKTQMVMQPAYYGLTMTIIRLIDRAEDQTTKKGAPEAPSS